MELSKLARPLEECGRPQHLKIDRWYAEQRTPFGIDRWSELGEHEVHRQKQRRRIGGWWRKPTESSYDSESPSSDKLAEAKRRQFTAKGKQERVAKSLAALSQPPHIRLTSTEWRQIVEDPDLEDQSL